MASTTENNAVTDVIISTRRADVIRRRLSGETMQSIGDFYGVSKVTIFNDIQASLRELGAERKELTAEYLDLELARLDALQSAIWTMAIGGKKDPSLWAVDRILQIMEMRAKLLGLNAPTKVSIDWRKELEDAGIPAGEVRERLINSIAETLGSGESAADAGSDNGSTETSIEPIGDSPLPAATE
jgi:hypothetical protein